MILEKSTDVQTIPKVENAKENPSTSQTKKRGLGALKRHRCLRLRCCICRIGKGLQLKGPVEERTMNYMNTVWWLYEYRYIYFVSLWNVAIGTPPDLSSCPSFARFCQSSRPRCERSVGCDSKACNGAITSGWIMTRRDPHLSFQVSCHNNVCVL